MTVAITPVYAGILALWVIFLSARVGTMRQRLGVGVGDGGSTALLHAVRAHGNAVETIPLTLLLMALAEVQLATPPFVLHLVGIALVAGRVMHGVYFMRGAKALALRGAGMGLTVIAQGVLALGLIAHALFGGAP